MLASHNIDPRRLAEVGCGAGGVLAALKSRLTSIQIEGWDIAPGASKFWTSHSEIKLVVGDFLAEKHEKFDILLLLDVLEHVANPHDFLSRLAMHGDYFIFHFPLDLSVASVLREKPILLQRQSVGHIHYFTRNLAIALLSECGYEVIEARFTGAHLRARVGFKGKLASLLRRFIFSINREWGVRLLGGDTLIVLAKSPGDTI